MRLSILLSLAILASPAFSGHGGVVRAGGAVVGDKRVFQLLDLAELKKFDWRPGSGDVPMTPEKAILAADRFCKTHFPGKVAPNIWQLRLVSEKIDGVDRWYWLALYVIGVDTERTVTGRSMLVVPISFGGKVMTEITPK